MKLYNVTRIPDALLEPIIVSAGKAIGARTSNVAVSVNWGRGGGLAHRCDAIKLQRRWIKTDGGAFSVTIIKHHPCRDPLAIAERFYNVARHEWGHIRDYQTPGVHRRRWSSNETGPSGRRARHDVRPEEVRVYDMIDAADSKGRDMNACADAILALAIWIEEDRKK